VCELKGPAPKNRYPWDDRKGKTEGALQKAKRGLKPGLKFIVRNLDHNLVRSLEREKRVRQKRKGEVRKKKEDLQRKGGMDAVDIKASAVLSAV